MTTVQRIKLLAKQQGRSIAYICKQLGFNSRTYFNDIEKSGREIPTDKLVIIANMLNTSVDYLLGKTDEPSPTKATIIELPNALSEQEQDLIDAYRAHPEMQAAVDRLLGIEKITVYVAAQDETKFDGNIEITRNKWEQIKNAPDETEPLL